MERHVIGEAKAREKAGPPQWPIAAIMAAAAVVRLLGVGYGLPYAFDFEEEINIRQAFTHTLDLRRTKMVPEDTSTSALPAYIYAAQYGALYGWAGLWRRVSSLDEYRALFLIRPGLFIVLARLASVAFGLAAVYLVYALCKSAFDWGVGVMAAVMMALSPHQVWASRLATGDAIALVAALGGLFFLLKMVMEKDFTNALYSALLLGLAGGAAFEYVAYLPAFMIVYLAVIPWHYKVRSTILGFLLGILCFAAGTLLVNIALVVTSPFGFVRAFATTSLSRMGVSGIFDLSRLREIFGRLASFDVYVDGIGWALLTAGVLGLLAGLAVAKWHRMRYLAVLVFGVVPAALLFPADAYGFKNWAFMMTPALAIGGGALLYRLFWRPHMPAAAGVVLLALFTATLTAQSAAQTSIRTARETARDTRTRYAQWAVENLPDGSAVLATPGARYLQDMRRIDWGGRHWQTYREQVMSAWGDKAFAVILTGLKPTTRLPVAVPPVEYVAVDYWSERQMRLLAESSMENLAQRMGLLEEQAEKARRDLEKIENARTEGELLVVFEEPEHPARGYGPQIEVFEVKEVDLPQEPDDATGAHADTQ